MRTSTIILGVTVAAALLSGSAGAQQTSTAAPLPVTRDSLEQWMRRVSNAGRWGPADELGTLNLITAGKRRAAAALVRAGTSVSLAHEIVPGPNPMSSRPFSLHYHTIAVDSLVAFGFDSTAVVFHGWAYSHVDALSHVAWRGALYNGFAIRDHGPSGTSRLGIGAMGAGIVTRGLLFDIPRLRGVPYLEPGALITAADLEEWERRTGIRAEPGDVVLIRTGRWAREEAKGGWDVTRGAAGPHPSVALWLHERGVAAMGGDVSNEYYPSVVPGVSDPLHELALPAMGMPLMDNLDLEAAARTAAAEQRWAFLFVAAPLRVRGGSGSMLNPLAVF